MPVKDRSSYDESWRDEWRDMRRFSPMARHTRRLIMNLLERVEKVETIGDIGCGDGELLREITSRFPGLGVWGCDFSGAAIEICR